MRSECQKGSRHGGVFACSLAFVKVENALGDNVSRACCQRSRMGLSAGVLVPMYIMRLGEVGWGCLCGGGLWDVLDFLPSP